MFEARCCCTRGMRTWWMQVTIMKPPALSLCLSDLELSLPELDFALFEQSLAMTQLCSQLRVESDHETLIDE